jgi:hypothetical protein
VLKDWGLMRTLGLVGRAEHLLDEKDAEHAASRPWESWQRVGYRSCAQSQEDVIMAKGTDDPGQPPEDQGALTRDELLAYAQAFAAEIVRWKVWYVQGYAEGPAQASLAEAQAIQALSLLLVELLTGARDACTRARIDFATVAAFLGCALRSPPVEAGGDLPDVPYAQDLQEQQDDAAFLRQYGLKFPDTNPDDAS